MSSCTSLMHIPYVLHCILFQITLLSIDWLRASVPNGCEASYFSNHHAPNNSPRMSLIVDINDDESMS